MSIIQNNISFKKIIDKIMMDNHSLEEEILLFQELVSSSRKADCKKAIHELCTSNEDFHDFCVNRMKNKDEKNKNLRVEIRKLYCILK
jgi:hypothetical protein